MSQIYKPGTGGGGGGGIETIAGDVGSITGTNVTIYANNTSNNAGGTVLFDNSGTVSTLNVTDVVGNTYIGINTGNNLQNTSNNTAVGSNALNSIGNNSSNNNAFGSGALVSFTGAAPSIGENSAFGDGCLNALTVGSKNVVVGGDSGRNLISGSYNNIFGNNAGVNLVSSESNNIIIGNEGVVGDNNTIRIGTDGSGTGQQNTCFIAGIIGNAVSNTERVTIDSVTGQLGVANNSIPSFQANLTAPQNLTGGSTTETIIFDGIVTNIGSGYNPATGVFTAPNTGFYAFTSCVFLNNLNSLAGNTTSVLAYTGSVQSLRLIQHGIGSYASGAQLILNISWSMPMTAGDTVQIQPFADGTGTYMATGIALSSGAFNVSSTFSGCQII